MMRKSWDEYFIDIAKQVASRSTCPRASVGAIIVRDRRIIATGYNGSAPGEPHCTDISCLMVDNHCIRTIHAETNAVAQAAKFGISTDGATLYFWADPSRPIESCINCRKVMRAAGIVRLVSLYGDASLNWY